MKMSEEDKQRYLITRGQDPEPAVGVKYHPPSPGITEKDFKNLKTINKKKVWSNDEIKIIAIKLKKSNKKGIPKKEFDKTMARELLRTPQSISRIRFLIDNHQI